MSNAQTIDAPISYNDIKQGTFKLQYEFGYQFNPKLPTIIVVADAQQFYVRDGRIKKIQNELFGRNFNVLGIIPRSTNEDLSNKIKLDKNDTTNWELAYTVFQSYQFVNDIELVISKVLKNQGEIFMYGQSGGAFLITEYLSVFFNSKVKKVFIGASVNPVVESKLGLIHDNFNRDYLIKNENDKKKLKSILNDNFFSRKLVASLFQRQNFFVELPRLNKERSALMNSLFLKDTSYINKLKKEYQIDAINNLVTSKSGISIRVRLSEFIYPLLKNWDKNLFYPDIENSFNIASPLLNSSGLNNITISSSFNEESIRKYKGEVFILSGRYDHVADYRSSIYLNGLLENSTLFLIDDDHTFKLMKSKNDYKKLIQSFFTLNVNHDWQSSFTDYLWKEK